MSTNTCVRVGESDTRIPVSEVEIWQIGATMHCRQENHCNTIFSMLATCNHMGLTLCIQAVLTGC